MAALEHTESSIELVAQYMATRRNGRMGRATLSDLCTRFKIAQRNRQKMELIMRVMHDRGMVRILDDGPEPYYILVHAWQYL